MFILYQPLCLSHMIYMTGYMIYINGLLFFCIVSKTFVAVSFTHRKFAPHTIYLPAYYFISGIISINKIWRHAPYKDTPPIFMDFHVFLSTIGPYLTLVFLSLWIYSSRVHRSRSKANLI